MAELEQTAAMAQEGGGPMLPISTDVRQPDSIRALFAATDHRFWPAGCFVQQRRHQCSPTSHGRSDVRAMVRCRRRESYRLVPLRAGSHPPHEGAEATRGRIINNGSLSAPCSAHVLGALHRHQACDHGAYEIYLARRPPTTLPVARLISATRGTWAGKPRADLWQPNGDVSWNHGWT